MIRATVENIHEALFAGPRSGVLAATGAGVEYLASHAQHATRYAEILAPYVRLIGMGGVCLVVFWNLARFLFWCRRRVLEFFAPATSNDHLPEPCRKCGHLDGYQVTKAKYRDEDDTDEDPKPLPTA